MNANQTRQDLVAELEYSLNMKLEGLEQSFETAIRELEARTASLRRMSKRTDIDFLVRAASMRCDFEMLASAISADVRVLQSEVTDIQKVTFAVETLNKIS